MSRAGGLALILLLGASAAAHAQTRVAQPGEEVRIFVRGVIAPLEGTLLSAGEDGPTVRTGDGAEMSIPPDQVERSEVLGSRRNTLRGAAVGAGVGIGVGVALMIASRENCAKDALGFCAPGEGENRTPLIVTPLLAAGAGALVGYVIRTGRWFPAVLPLTPATGDAALGLRWSVPFGG